MVLYDKPKSVVKHHVAEVGKTFGEVPSRAETLGEFRYDKKNRREFDSRLLDLSERAGDVATQFSGTVDYPFVASSTFQPYSTLPFFLPFESIST